MKPFYLSFHNLPLLQAEKNEGSQVRPLGHTQVISKESGLRIPICAFRSSDDPLVYRSVSSGRAAARPSGSCSAAIGLWPLPWRPGLWPPRPRDAALARARPASGLGHRGATAFPGNRNRQGGPLASGRSLSGPSSRTAARGGDLCSRWSAQLPLAPWRMVCPAPGRAAKSGERGERVEEGNSNSTSSWTPSSPAQKPPRPGQGSSRPAPHQGKAHATLFG